MRPELVSLLVSLVGALPGLIDALTPEAQATVREQLGAARTLLPAAGSVTDAVDGAIAKHTTAQTLARLARVDSGALLSGSERAAVARAALLLRDRDLLAPPALFEEPAGEDD
jgi:hypothetical protein